MDLWWGWSSLCLRCGGAGLWRPAKTAGSDVLVIDVVDCDGERWKKPAEKTLDFFCAMTRASGPYVSAS